jgi:hypothetical protein
MPHVVHAVSAQTLSGSVSSVTSPAMATTDGNLLAAVGVDNNGTTSEAATPFSDSGGHSWSVAVPINSSAPTTSTRFTQRYAPNITGQAAHTVTYTAPGNNFPSIAVAEIDGADTSLPEDQEAGNAPSSAGSNPHSSGTTGATIDQEEIAIAGLTHGGGSSEDITSVAGYTVVTKQTNTAGMPVAMSALELGSSAAAQEQFALAGNPSVLFAAGIATYRAGPPTSRPAEGFSRASPRP